MTINGEGSLVQEASGKSAASVMEKLEYELLNSSISAPSHLPTIDFLSAFLVVSGDLVESPV
jgi:hypothetical protein